MKQFIILSLLLISLAAVAHSAEPTVTNVRAEQKQGTKLVEISYDLSGGTPPNYVSLQVSSDGGTTFAVPAAALSGDLGTHVPLGRNKRIVWNAGSDWNNQLSNAVRFRVTASNAVPVVIFADNFDDNSIDVGKWTATKVRVQELSGVMRVGTDATDNGGFLLSLPITVQGRGDITIRRKVKIHRASDYFAADISMRFGSVPWASIYYAHHAFSGSGFITRFGSFIGRNVEGAGGGGAWVHVISSSEQSDVSGPFQVIFDSWFNEKFVYSPSSGLLQYFVNDQKVTEYFIGIMQQTDSPTIQFSFRAWGWYTGHEQLIDDFIVSQDP